jgi:DNA-binding CsgD family transcriptional regulator/PAS domain-containing protein
MLSQERFDAALSLIHEAALDVALWKDVLRTLAQATGCVAGGLTLENPHNRKGRPLTYFGFDESHVNKTFDHYLPMNPLFGIADRMVPGFVVANGDVVAPEAFRRSEFYNGWARPQKLGSPLTLVLHRSETCYCPLTLVRPDGAGEAVAEDRALLRRLAPPLTRALDVSLRLEGLKSQGASMEAAFARMAMAVFLVDGQGRVAYANPAAEALLRDGATLYRRNGALACRDRAASRRLSGAIEDSIRRDRPAESIEIAVVTEGAGPAIVAVVPIASESPFAPLLAATPRCAVFVNDRRAAERDGVRRFALRHKLTRSETRLLRAILGGGGLAQAAEEMNVKLSTAHTHLKRVFAKTETNRQGELIRLALTSFLPLRTERERGS